MSQNKVLALIVVFYSSINLNINKSSSQWAWLSPWLHWSTVWLKLKESWINLGKNRQYNGTISLHWYLEDRVILIFGYSLLVMCIKSSCMSGFEILVWMRSKKIRWSCEVHKLNSTTEEWIFPSLLITCITPSLEPLVSAKFSWFTTFPVSSSSASFHTWIPPPFWGLGVMGRVKTVLSKTSIMSLGTETGRPHATEGSKDIRSLRRETLEKQLTSLKAKSSLLFSTDFANEDKAIEI